MSRLQLLQSGVSAAVIDTGAAAPARAQHKPGGRKDKIIWWMISTLESFCPANYWQFSYYLTDWLTDWQTGIELVSRVTSACSHKPFTNLILTSSSNKSAKVSPADASSPVGGPLCCCYQLLWRSARQAQCWHHQHLTLSVISDSLHLHFRWS